MAVPRVAVADRSVFVRGIVRRLCQLNGLRVVAVAASGSELVDLCGRHRSDVVVAGPDLADGPLASHIEGLVASGSRVLVLAGEEDHHRAVALVHAGASDYVGHESPAAAVIQAVFDLSGDGGRSSIVVPPSSHA